MQKNKVTCILCPRGCTIERNVQGEKIELNGFGCKKGLEWAKEEFTNPKRILTTTVHVKDGEVEFVPVRTKIPIPKDKIFEAILILKNIEISAPVEIESVIMKNILDTGADVIATRRVSKKNSSDD
ncbi:protein of unknown function DUF1667 [Caldicellulosiruptor obsidiansis OB47]|uniref:DUF1667 domain-containing protein n=1 Tax=Caldicellulosiruptor obsidiansis (strain ATCC BAA-2073 / JCM 16842 / OB47) TaxID=608506 RepID=D9TLG4_CALOO|nr:DUF1667 domain-containing protein [Caldicellulosiruptor obsidiansis]ADL42846.1 protein of unknown function DUF1667 [Caldicellulosiruptor obsidiansis OB47]